MFGIVGFGAVLSLWPGGKSVPLAAHAGIQSEPEAAPSLAVSDPAWSRRAVPHEPEAAAADVPADAMAEATVDLTKIEAWIRDLRDDHIRFNATWAESNLRTAGPAAHDALLRALAGGDVQQREIAGRILVVTGAPPNPLVAAAAVDLLGDRGHDIDHWRSAIRWLEEHPEAARPKLTWGLGSTHRRQRLVCAFVLARSGFDDPISRRILMDHLGDNESRGDALMAAHGLFRIGPRVLPTLRAAMPYSDRQALSLLRLIELDLVDPPRDQRALEARRQLHDVTKIYFDPVWEYDYWRSALELH